MSRGLHRGEALRDRKPRSAGASRVGGRPFMHPSWGDATSSRSTAGAAGAAVRARRSPFRAFERPWPTFRCDATHKRVPARRRTKISTVLDGIEDDARQPRLPATSAAPAALQDPLGPLAFRPVRGGRRGAFTS